MECKRQNVNVKVTVSHLAESLRNRTRNLSKDTYISVEDSQRAHSDYKSEASKPTQIDRLLSIVSLSRPTMNSSAF